MAGRIIQLTEPRRIVEPPFIDISIRADIGDYGPPGVHLHGPLALKGRARAAALGIAGARDGDGNGDGDGADCAPKGGTTINFSADVAASATTVNVSRQISRPFVIRHIYQRAEDAVTAGSSVRYKISEDDSTTGGADTTGTDIDNYRAAGPGWNIETTQREFFPNHLQRQVPIFIKAVMINGSAATNRFRISMSIEFV